MYLPPDQVHAVVGVLQDETDPLVSVMKLEKAPKESYADVGGLEQQIQEIKESVELPLTHPEYYEEMGIRPPKGVILYGAPGTGSLFNFYTFCTIYPLFTGFSYALDNFLRSFSRVIFASKFFPLHHDGLKFEIFPP